MSRELSVADQIAQAERKLDLRRERTQRHLGETGQAVRRVTEKLPMAAAVGALALGVIAGRSRAAPSAAVPGRAGLAATALAVVSTLARIAMSPDVRSLWQSYRASRPAAAPSGRP